VGPSPGFVALSGVLQVEELARGMGTEIGRQALGGGLTVRLSDGRIVAAEDLPVPFVGFDLVLDAIEDEAAEEAILKQIEAWPWQPSQSGRWKQDFGPKANFKRRQVKVPDDWQGFPVYARELMAVVCSRCPSLEGFEAAEFLALRYDSDRGANHALHVDDTWLWGERIIGVSLGSAAVFTFYEPQSQTAVRVPLPRRSAMCSEVGCASTGSTASWRRTSRERGWP